ncbi:MAG: hypothetical protein HY908_06915 [Myxococcales bacterium]|nr:hypothetical protein [Myxococcales bacterium]
MKHTDVVSVTKSMRIATQDLDLAHLFVVHPGTAAHALDDRVSAQPSADLPSLAADRRLHAD